ncbi:hypothetical protein, partial [Campylobacter troglodytis]|uniref:hypothetical protein n=1 Tax=Campylobacter troglodytis TaxID=654363 RepID=UPI00163BEC8C
MPYFATLYIETIKPKLALLPIEMPHAFLGLTRKHPDELDELAFEKNIEYWDYNIGKMVILTKEEIKWYEKFEAIDYNDGFYGFAPVESNNPTHWGKVFENNHFVPKWNSNRQIYEYTQRAKSSFNENNRCVFEISKEQYEALLESIKQDVQKTKDRNANLQKDNSKLVNLETLMRNLYYSSNPYYALYNCTTWALHKLDSIGIEVIDINEWIPDILPNPSLKLQTTKLVLKQVFDIEFNLVNTFKDSTKDIEYYHDVFNKFQSIDKNLESIKGAKAFRMWARSMIENNYICHIDYKILEQKIQTYCTKNMSDKYYNRIKKFYTIKSQLQSIYNKLNSMLEKIISQVNDTNLKGNFEFIYWDKQDERIKTLKSNNNYESSILKEMDLSKAANEYTISKFLPFIFISKDKTLSQKLYHKYNYGNVSSEYQIARNEFYQNVLARIQSDKYWSSSY